MFRAPPLTPLVKVLLIGLFSAFVLETLVVRLVGIDLVALLAIHAGDGLGISLLWQVVTHVLVHGVSSAALMSLLVTLLFLWWMGAPFEARFGAAETGKLLFVGTLSAGMAGAVATVFFGGVVAGSGPWLGALITGYAATIPPGAQLSLLGIVPMKRNTLILVVAGFIVLSALIEGTWAVMIANLTALGAAWVWMKSRLAPRKPKAPRRRKNGGSGRFQVIQGGRDDDDDPDDDPPKYLN
jgi:membrane associated rhomboid family serine protease